ncbi:MAG: hypothetical protein ACTSUE_27595 [Promethearchaeota archaeon]
MDMHLIKQIFNKGKEDYKRGLFNQALQKWKIAFEKFREEGNTEGMAEVLYNLSMVQKKLGYFQEAIINLKESLELFQFLKKDKRIVMTLHALGLAHSEIDENDIAWRYYEETSVLYKNTGDKKGMASVLFEIGNIHLKKNELEDAGDCYAKALELQEELGDKLGTGLCHYALSILAFKEDRRDDIKKHLRVANQIFKESSFTEGIIKVKMLLGAIQLKNNDYNNAEKSFRESLRFIAEKYFRTPEKSGINDKREEVQLLLYMGELFLKDSALNLPEIGETLNLKAYEYFNEAAKFAEAIGYKEGKCKALFNMGMILHERASPDDVANSAEKFSNSLEIAKEIKNNELVTKCLLFLGINNRRLKKYDRALTYLQDCLIFTQKLRYKRLETRGLIEKFKILHQLGRLEDALTTLKKADALARGEDYRDLIGEIYCLKGEYYQVIGNLGESNDNFSEAKSVFQKAFNKKGIIKALFGIAKLNEQQGYLSHAISCLEEIEALYHGSNEFKEISSLKIEKARLLMLSGNIDKAIDAFEAEIKFLDDVHFQGSLNLAIKAKFMLYRIYKDKKDLIEAGLYLKDVLDYYIKNERLEELFDLFIDEAYESINDGNFFGLKESISNLWRLLKSKKKFDASERIVYFLHILGIVHQQEGNIEYARNFFNECLSVINRFNLVEKEGVILAQMGFLAYNEGKDEAMNLLQEARRKLPEYGSLESRINIDTLIGKILYSRGEIDEALDYIQEATKDQENLFILSSSSGNYGMKTGFRVHVFETNLFKFLSGLYLRKYIEEKNELHLKRSLIALEFSKIKSHYLDYFSKSVFKIYKGKEKIQEYIDIDNDLNQKAMIRKKSMDFLINHLEKQKRLFLDKESNKEFIKKTIESIRKAILSQKGELDSLIVAIKKNRVHIMSTNDSGSFIPFLGFELIDNVNKAVTWNDEIVYLDYAVLTDVSLLPIFILKGKTLEVVVQDLNLELLRTIEELEYAIEKDELPEILIAHNRLTKYLFPPPLKKMLIDIGVKYILASPDNLFQDVSFMLLGGEDGVSADFTFFYTPNILSLKILLNIESFAKADAPLLDYYLFYPDTESLQVRDELEDISEFFERQERNLGTKASIYNILPDAEANYSSMIEMDKLSPQVIHFSGLLFLSQSTPLKGFFNLSDRMFFFENALELDFKKKGMMIACSVTNDMRPGNQQAFTMWRTFSLIDIPNYLISLSRFGYSGIMYSKLYEKLTGGMTLGQAFHETVNELKNIQELSPLTWGSSILIGNPLWKLKSR